MCIVSLRCAAGLQKEIDSLCAGFKRNGWKARQILAESYRAYRDDSPDVDFVQTGGGYGGILRGLWRESRKRQLRQRFIELQPDLVLFYNQSPLNLQLLRLRHLLPSCKFGVCLHDPWKPSKLKYGLRYAFTYTAVEWLQKRTVRRVDWVVTLSNFGTSLLRTYYPEFTGSHTQARILLDDRPIEAKEKTVVSIIGRMNASTGHEHFISLAKSVHAINKNLRFEVVTSSAAATEMGFVSRAEAAGVVVKYQSIMSEADIESAIARSICVFRLDEELTQSGVIPVCYRAGTAVIVRDIPGLAQHVEDGLTGYVLTPQTSPETIAAQITVMQADPTFFSTHCRAAFKDKWSQELFHNYYSGVINNL